MSRIVLLVAALAFVACKKAEPTKSEAAKTQTAQAETAKTTEGAAKGQSFGAGVKLASSTPIDAILAEPKKFAGQTVRVEGTVTDVCEMRGCWMELAGDKPGAKLRFKVTDGEMVFPVDSKGKHAVAEGVVTVKDLSLEDTKAMAIEEAKEHGEDCDPDKITEAKSIVRLDGIGAVIAQK
jgi:hypothetical protein